MERSDDIDVSSVQSSPLPSPSNDEGGSSSAVARPSGDDLARLRERWPDVVELVAARKNARAWLPTARPVHIEDGWLTISFDGRTQLSSAKRNQAEIEAAVQQVIGRKLKIRCTVRGDDGIDSASGFGSDPVLRFAVSKFGGELRALETPAE